MLLASNFERGLGGCRPVNLAGSVTANLVSEGTAYSGSSFLRVSTTAPDRVHLDARRQRHRPGPGSYDLRVEFHLDTVGTSLDIDCVFVN